MSNESPFTNATSSHSDADFWRTLASEFKVVAEKYDCQNAVLQFLYRDGDQPETWIVLDASKQGVIALTRLAILAFRKLGGTAQDSPWDAWARHLVNNDECHPFGWGPWNSKGQLDLENGTVDFEGYLRRQRFALIEESIEFCRRKGYAAQLVLDEASGQTVLIGGSSSISPPHQHLMATAEKREATGMSSNRTVTNDRRALYQDLRNRCADAHQQVNQGILAKRADSAWNDRTWVKRWTHYDSRVEAVHDRKIRRAIQQWLMELEEKSPKSPKSPDS